MSAQLCFTTAGRSGCRRGSSFAATACLGAGSARLLPVTVKINKGNKAGQGMTGMPCSPQEAHTCAAYTSERQKPPGSWEQLSIPMAGGQRSPRRSWGCAHPCTSPGVSGFVWPGRALGSDTAQQPQQQRDAQEPHQPCAPLGHVFGGLGGYGFTLTADNHSNVEPLCKRILRVFSGLLFCS